jgi:hypothetical protein
MDRRLIAVLAGIAVATVACGTTITLPTVGTTSPDVTEKVTAPVPATGEPRLTISFGAGHLKLGPGASGLVDGEATYNVPDLKPQVATSGASVEIRQGDLRSVLDPTGVRNDWDLKLGSVPMDLTINAGAYMGEFELGGLALTGLTIKDGAATVEAAFSQPNPTEMAVLRYETGASNVKLKSLANANFTTLVFNSGAGDYTLDFGGQLKRDAAITVSTGLSNVILVVPANVPATVKVESGVSNVNAGPGWNQDGSVYTQSGSGASLTFLVKTGAGNLTLTR